MYGYAAGEVPMSEVIAVDLGNSVAKFARVRDGEVCARAHIATALLRDIDSGADLLAHVPALSAVIQGRPPVILGSVVSWAGARLAALMTGLDCTVRPAISLDFTALGMWIRYRSGEPGVDRVAACAEAFARSGGPLIVIGLGTAVHTNVVAVDGTYRGGAIMPGLRLMSESLGVGTDQVGVIVPESPSRVIGTSTPECVEIGLFHGWLGGTLRLIDETRRELKEIDPTGKTPALWISGGHAEWIAPELPDAHVDADLSVLGLARLWNALH